MTLALPRFHRLGALPAIVLFIAALTATTGAFWSPQLAAAQEPEAGGISVVLVVDDSRSMVQTDPEQRRGLGGRLLMERLFTEDQIATVLFSRRARVATPLSAVQSNANRDHLKTSLSLLQSSGGTDMLDALNQAFAELENDSTANPKFVVFLTDGRLLDSDLESAAYTTAFADLLREYRANEWPVFPISFGQDVDAAFLANIAEVTGGETCDAPTDAQLAACFQTVLDKFKEAERVLAVPPRCLQPGENVDYSIYVDPYAKQFSVVIAQQDFSGQATILDPTGTPISTARQEGRFLVYNFARPTEGTWTVRLTGSGCFGESFAYIQSDVQIAMDSPGRVHAAGQPMPVAATIEGRRLGSGWEPLDGDLTLASSSPDGILTSVTLKSQGGQHLGTAGTPGEIGDYRLMFEATVGFRDPRTGEPQQRVYLRQRRVEVVEAPGLQASVNDTEVHRILPGDSIEIAGRITSIDGLRSPRLSATLAGQELDIHLESGGGFTGTVVPTKAGRQTLELSLESILTGRYGEVSYPAATTKTIIVEFLPVDLTVSLADNTNPLDPGSPANIVGQFQSNGNAVEIDQVRLPVKVATQGQNPVTVTLTRDRDTREYRGSFVPKESGDYTASAADANLSRNGVAFTAEAAPSLEITLRSMLEVEGGGITLGQLYLGEVVTRQLLVTNNSRQDIPLTAQTGNNDLSAQVSPAVIRAGARQQPLEVQFQVNHDASFSGAELRSNLTFNPGASSELVVPLTYEIGDFFVEVKDNDNNLGFLSKTDRTIPVQLELGYNSPVPVRVSAKVTDASGETEIDLGPLSNTPLLLSGEGTEALTLLLPIPENTPPGAYQGSVRIVSDPPIPVKFPGEADFSYRLASGLEQWVLDNWWWALAATAGVLLVALTVWGGVVTERLSIQGRLLIYDRTGVARARREDLRRFGRPEVTLGSRADISLPDSTGMIDQEHAQIVAIRGTEYPRVYPVGPARVVGPFGEDVDVTGVPLGAGDTFSIGRYNLEWSPTWAKTRIGRLVGDPWWKRGFLLSVLVVGLVAVGFYLALL